MMIFILMVIFYVLNIVNVWRGILSFNIFILKIMLMVFVVIICIDLLINILGVILFILKLYEIKG